jgi:uncharacterized membrane protein
MKVTKKQQSLLFKIAIIAVIALVAYVVFKNIRNIVSDKVSKRISKDMAKETIGQVSPLGFLRPR